MSDPNRLLDNGSGAPVAYSDRRDFDPSRLQDLFRSVGWSSAEYPDELALAMQNSDRVVSAWHGDRLVGLMNALSDGAMTAYFHYLLVRPEYQGRGIGRALVSAMLDHYRGYARKVLIAYDTQVGFYEACGFNPGASSTPMFVMDLTT